MDDGLKQRLIGAVVLLAIAIIFLPALFDRETITPVDRVSQIPPAPEIEIEPISVAQPPVVASPAPEPEAMFIPDETKPERPTPETPASEPPVPEPSTPKLSTPKPSAPKPSAPEPPSLNKNSVPKGWSLQVVSYTEEAKAQAFRDRLIQDGYRASYRKTRTSKGARFRVYIGPKLDKAAMLKIKSQVEKKYKLKAILLDITPKK